MRIVCDNCGAKYQIGDDKVRNKVFKIRCKRCAHVIVVRSSGDGEAAEQPGNDEPTRVVKQPVAEVAAEVAAPADAIWYVVVNRESLGPLTKEQVVGYHSRGEVDGEAFTWAEGMADWTRLASVPEFGHLFPSPGGEAEPTVGDGDGRGFAGLDRVQGEVEDDDEDVMASNNVADVAVVAASPAVQDAHGPRVSSNLRNQRNENSVLFSLDSLAAEERAPRVSNTGGTEGSGLIDISAILGGGGAAARPASAGLDDPFGGGAGFAPVSAAPIGGAPMPSLVTRSGPSTGKVVALTAAIVLLLGGGAAAWWFLVRAPAETPQVAQSTPPVSNKVTIGGAVAPPTAAPSTAPVTPPSAAPTVAAAPTTEAAPETDSVVAEAAGDKSKSRVPKPTAPARRASTRKASAPTRPAQPDPEDAPPARTERPKPTPRPAKRPVRGGGGDELDNLLGSLDGKQAAKRPAGGGASPPAAGGGAADPLLPERLNRDQILHVVRKNADAIRQCRQVDPNASGTVMVNMLIGRSGQVQRADVGTASFKGTPVGNCVEGKVMSFRFPQFSGEPMRVNMPFAL